MKTRSPTLHYTLRFEILLLFNLLIGWGGLWSSPLKGDGGLSLLVEHLKVLNSRACLRIQFTYFFFDLFEGQISN